MRNLNVIGELWLGCYQVSAQQDCLKETVAVVKIGALRAACVLAVVSKRDAFYFPRRLL